MENCWILTNGLIEQWIYNITPPTESEDIRFNVYFSNSNYTAFLQLCGINSASDWATNTINNTSDFHIVHVYLPQGRHGSLYLRGY